MMSSCNTGTSGGSRLSGSTGSTYELLVVTSPTIWEGEVGETVQNFFHQDDTTLLMVEPLYTTPQISMKQFEENIMFQYFKNILFIDIDPTREASIETRDTIWARPQRIFKIVAPDNASFDVIFDEYKDYMLERYIENEREKLNVYFQTALNKKVMQRVYEKFGCNMNITTGFYIAKDLDDFMWLRSETSKTSTNIMIYSEDYVKESQLNPNYIVLKRNIITKENIPASLPDSYAKISDYHPVSSKVVDLNGLYGIETRGAWDCSGDFMGGTFLNYTLIDEKNNKVLTVDGFIYAPSREKRVFMMQLEALFWSLHVDKMKNDKK